MNKGHQLMDTQMKSKWIKGFEGHYSIREDGALYSHERKVPHGRDGFFRIIRGRWIRVGRTTRGYQCCILRKDGKNHNVMIHRLVAKAFVDGDSNLEVNHKDCNKDNNHKDNLEWVTTQENISHAWANGLYDSLLAYQKRGTTDVNNV